MNWERCHYYLALCLTQCRATNTTKTIEELNRAKQQCSYSTLFYVVHYVHLFRDSFATLLVTAAAVMQPKHEAVSTFIMCLTIFNIAFDNNR